MAEGVGFEPTVPEKGTTVFKTVTIDHSDTPPTTKTNQQTALYETSATGAGTIILFNLLALVVLQRPPGYPGQDRPD